MPKALEKKLKSQARKKFHSTTSKRARAYIYGAMRKTGWRPKHQGGNSGGKNNPGPILMRKPGSDGFLHGA